MGTRRRVFVFLICPETDTIWVGRQDKRKVLTQSARAPASEALMMMKNAPLGVAGTAKMHAARQAGPRALGADSCTAFRDRKYRGTQLSWLGRECSSWGREREEVSSVRPVHAQSRPFRTLLYAAWHPVGGWSCQHKRLPFHQCKSAY
jgi:hypothetical protein